MSGAPKRASWGILGVLAKAFQEPGNILSTRPSPDRKAAPASETRLAGECERCHKAPLRARNYSVRRARIGSKAAARRAGKTVAMRAAKLSTRVVTSKMSG